MVLVMARADRCGRSNRHYALRDVFTYETLQYISSGFLLVTTLKKVVVFDLLTSCSFTP
jgi:hypothetical protein